MNQFDPSTFLLQIIDYKTVGAEFIGNGDPEVFDDPGMPHPRSLLKIPDFVIKLVVLLGQNNDHIMNTGGPDLGRQKDQILPVDIVLESRTPKLDPMPGLLLGPDAGHDQRPKKSPYHLIDAQNRPAQSVHLIGPFRRYSAGAGINLDRVTFFDK